MQGKDDSLESNDYQISSCSKQTNLIIAAGGLNSARNAPQVKFFNSHNTSEKLSPQGFASGPPQDQPPEPLITPTSQNAVTACQQKVLNIKIKPPQSAKI